jgi:hypothetical protein
MCASIDGAPNANVVPPHRACVDVYCGAYPAPAWRRVSPSTHGYSWLGSICLGLLLLVVSLPGEVDDVCMQRICVIDRHFCLD